MGFLKYKRGVLNCICHLNFPVEDVFREPGLLDIILKIKESLKYKQGILYFISRLNFPVEDVF